MTVTGEPRSTSLYYREGSSDKEYHARLEAADAGFVVTFAYGRRGAALSTGTKTAAPVEYAKAAAIFDKLVAGKESKGYTRGEDGTPYQNSGADRQPSGLLPQLLNVVGKSDLNRIIADPAWCLQEKMDGRRMMVRKSDDTIEAINKLGLVVSLSDAIVTAARTIGGDFTLDGEVIGDCLHAFDLLSLAGDDIRDTPYRDRYTTLTELLRDSGPAIVAVPSADDADAKADRLTTLKAAGAEGVVLKRLDAPYRAGRPNNGGTQLKFKFVETLSALVTVVNDRRSVGLSLHGDDGLTFVGNVTIPANHDVPPCGAVVEVRYLYAAPALYQPVYLGVRDDVEPSECVMAQVKYKNGLDR